LEFFKKLGFFVRILRVSWMRKLQREFDILNSQREFEWERVLKEFEEMFGGKIYGFLGR